MVQRFLVKYQISQVTWPLYSPDLVPCDFWLYPKLKSPSKGKRFQTIDKSQENTVGQLMAIGRTMWGPKVPTLKGTEASLSYVQCFFNKCLCFSYYMAGYFLDIYIYTPCLELSKVFNVQAQVFLIKWNFLLFSPSISSFLIFMEFLMIIYQSHALSFKFLIISCMTPIILYFCSFLWDISTTWSSRPLIEFSTGI